MSYEGSLQKLCAKGHRFDSDAYSSEPTCYACQGVSVWANGVDETNCESWGEIPDHIWESELRLTEATSATYNLGHVHITEEATYRQPTEDELVRFRHWRPNQESLEPCNPDVHAGPPTE